MQTRVRQRGELNAEFTSLFDADVEFVQLRVPALLGQSRVGFDCLNGIDYIIGVEFFTIGPHYAWAQINRHLGEIIIVYGAGNRQRINVLARFLIAIPECLQHQRMVVRRTAASAPNIVVAYGAPNKDLVHDKQIRPPARHLDWQTLRFLGQAYKRWHCEQRQQ